MAEIEVRFRDLLSSYLTKFSVVNRETARRAWQGGGFGVTNFTDTGALSTPAQLVRVPLMYVG